MPTDPYRRLARFYDVLFKTGARGLSKITVGLANAPEDASVLDVGCGTGILLAHCVELGLRAHGVDLSGAMLQQARRRLGDSADLRQGDGRRLPFQNDTFDAVFATMVLHELDPDTRRRTLDEMIRVTRSSGVLAVADYHDGGIHGLGGLFTRVFTTAAELAAGGAHYAGYRHFKSHGCLPGLVAPAPLTLVNRKVVAGGNLAVHVLRPS